jgi:4-carboxymuconolactone decarboxylase
MRIPRSPVSAESPPTRFAVLPLAPFPTRFARQLSMSHRVDDAAFTEARKTFGDRGIVDLIVLAGTYYTVCGLLNAFDVPAPSENPN